MIEPSLGEIVFAIGKEKPRTIKEIRELYGLSRMEDPEAKYVRRNKND